MKKKDFTGMKFGDLTVLKEDTNKHLEYLEKKKRGEVINAPIFWICECACGNTISLPVSRLIGKPIKNCGMCVTLKNTIDNIDFDVWSNKNKNPPSYYSPSSNKKVWVRCRYGHEDYLVRAQSITKGKYGCPICANKKVVRGINDVATTHPHLVKYFAKIEDAYSNTYGSMKKIQAICPECHTKKEIRIQDLYRQGLSCNKCSDGISYPNKFIYELLVQLGVTFNREEIFDFAKNKRYDFYLPYYKCIIEAHGRQHYDVGFETCGGKTFLEIQKNDEIKSRIANENGIKHYVVLDCRKSEMNWIKNSIMNSELPKLLNFKEEDIDWSKCHDETSSSRVKEFCDLWNSGVKSSTDIALITGYDISTIIQYLKNYGNLFGCDYNLEFEKQKNLFKPKLKQEEVVEIFNSNESIKTLADRFNVNPSSIRDIKNLKTWKKVTSQLLQGGR